MSLKKVLKISLLSILTLTLFAASADGAEQCNKDQKKSMSMLLYIQCDVNDLQYKKLTLVEESKNDIDKYSRQHANAMVSFTELKIQSRNQLIARLKKGSIDNLQQAI